MKRIRQLLPFLLCFFLCACHTQPIRADHVLDALMAQCDDLPAGSVYRSGAEEGSEAYFSPSLLRALYGESAETAFSSVADYAVYLSAHSYPAELAVFVCHSASDTDPITALCLNRRDALQVALRGTSWERDIESIFIVSQGRFVVMGFAKNSEALQKEALRLIG